MFLYYCLFPIAFDKFLVLNMDRAIIINVIKVIVTTLSVIIILTKAIATVVLILITVLKVLSLASRRPSGTLREHLSVSSPAS